MKYLHAFRNKAAAQKLKHDINTLAHKLPVKRTPFRIMEVCGTHTMAIAKNGIRDLLPDAIQLISGPGCPVCVTAAGYIDAAIELIKQDCLVCSFGDMLRVPGSTHSLAHARSQGGQLEVVYSPDGALQLATANPDRQIVFLGIGFETTIAPVVSLIKQAVERDIPNLSVLTAFKQVPPALAALADDPEVKVDAFLCPAHVSAIIGTRAYEPFVEKYQIPCVIGGFEPLDILYAIYELLNQHLQDSCLVVNQYERVVKHEGNKIAQALLAEYLEPYEARWRGIGTIPQSGLRLKPAYAKYDAAQRFDLKTDGGVINPACRCGEVLKGIISPPQCRLFGKTCNPDHPIGPCMVSSEGSCAAHYKYNASRYS